MYITDILLITLSLQVFIFSLIFILSITTRRSLKKMNEKLETYEESLFFLIQEVEKNEHSKRVH